jgi:peptide/nickel transport system permease protein
MIGDPTEYVGIPHDAPSGAHPLGTTGQGQDVLAQTVAGTRASLAGGLLVGAAVVLVGALVGVTAGYVGGALDAALSLVTNVLLVVPSLPLAIVVAAYLPPGPWTVGLVLVATGWAWNARVLRAQALSLRERDHVLAARVAGESPARIIASELLPNMGPLLLSQFVGATTYAIGAQVGLEFLGMGDVARVTWGSNLYWAANDAALLTGAWWTFVPTGSCIALVALALSLLNTSVDEAANPALARERAWRRYLRGARVEPGAATPVVSP